MNSTLLAALQRLARLRVVLVISLIWAAPTLACGSFAPRPTPTPTPPPEVNPVATEIALDEQPLPTPLPPATETPEPELAATPTVSSTLPTVAPGAALAVGAPARVTAPAGLNYRDLPSTDSNLLGQFGTGIRVTVVEGPVTADDFVWWRIDDGQGNVGWAAEGDGDTVWINPRLGDPQPANRPPQVGDRVQVTMGAGGQLSVRTQPGTDAPLSARVDNGQQFTILAGPQSAGSLTWYQIRSDDGAVEGWAADGDGGERWLSPLE
jgi:hypothetical protein